MRVTYRFRLANKKLDRTGKRRNGGGCRRLRWRSRVIFTACTAVRSAFNDEDINGAGHVRDIIRSLVLYVKNDPPIPLCIDTTLIFPGVYHKLSYFVYRYSTRNEPFSGLREQINTWFFGEKRNPDRPSPGKITSSVCTNKKSSKNYRRTNIFIYIYIYGI
jgi:hypothetical protein